MMVIGIMVKSMDMAKRQIQLNSLHILVNGKTVSNTDKELKTGKMDPFMKVAGQTEIKMVLVSSVNSMV